MLVTVPGVSAMVVKCTQADLILFLQSDRMQKGYDSNQPAVTDTMPFSRQHNLSFLYHVARLPGEATTQTWHVSV